MGTSCLSDSACNFLFLVLVDGRVHSKIIAPTLLSFQKLFLYLQLTEHLWFQGLMHGIPGAHSPDEDRHVGTNRHEPLRHKGYQESFMMPCKAVDLFVPMWTLLLDFHVLSSRTINYMISLNDFKIGICYLSYECYWLIEDTIAQWASRGKSKGIFAPNSSSSQWRSVYVTKGTFMFSNKRQEIRYSITTPSMKGRRCSLGNLNNPKLYTIDLQSLGKSMQVDDHRSFIKCQRAKWSVMLTFHCWCDHVTLCPFVARRPQGTRFSLGEEKIKSSALG